MTLGTRRSDLETSATDTLPFDTCIVIYNPISTQAQRAMGYTSELRGFFPPDDLIFIPTSPEGKQANKKLIVDQAEKLGSRTLLVVAGGDGTVNLVVDTILHDSRLSVEARKTVILPFWGGNGNDLAHMLNGTAKRSRIRKVLETGRSVAIYPLSCEISRDKEIHSYTAICYASFGASAFAASRLEKMRGIRPFFHAIGVIKFMHELSMVAQSLIKAPLFTVEDAKSTHPIFDRVFINGPRFAKVAGSPLKLTDKKFLNVVVEQKRVSSLAYHITELTRRHAERYTVKDGHSVSFTLREPTWAQIDGEVMYLHTGTKVRVGLDERAFYGLSTLLA
jgi:diacylglycerol kinase family enzyme